MRVALDRDASVLADEARRLAGSLRDGDIGLDEWRAGMRTLTKQTHITATALAVGGRDQVTASEWGTVGNLIKQEYEYLDHWVLQMIAGEAPMDGRMENRAAMYTEAGRHTFHHIQRNRKEGEGHDEERSVLHPAEHCGECIAEAAAGWRPIGLMIPIGARQCLRRCHCTVEYRKSDRTAAQDSRPIELVLTDKERARRLADLDRRIAIAEAEGSRSLGALRATRTKVLNARRPDDAGPPPPPPPPTPPKFDATQDERILDYDRRIAAAEAAGEKGKASALRANRTRLLRKLMGEGGPSPTPRPTPAKPKPEPVPKAKPKPQADATGFVPPATLTELETRVKAAIGANVVYEPHRHDRRAWGTPIRSEKARLALGSKHLKELERLRALYPKMKGIDTVYITTSSGGRASLRTGSSHMAMKFSSHTNTSAEDIAKYQRLKDATGAEWTVGLLRGDWQPGVVRHETAHSQTTHEAQHVWQAVKNRLKLEGFDLDAAVDRPETGSITLSRQSTRRLTKFKVLFSEYGGSDDLWEEIAEAGSMVSAPWYQRGTLPRLIEEYVDRLYNGADFTGLL